MAKRKGSADRRQRRPALGDEGTTQQLENPPAVSATIEQRLEDLELGLTELRATVQKRGYDTRPIFEKHEKEIEQINEDLEKLAGQRMDQIDKDLERKCVYCGNGVYRKVLDSRSVAEGQLPDELLFWGIAYRQSEIGRWWVVFCCNYCGNVQRFNLSEVQYSKGWNRS